MRLATVFVLLTALHESAFCEKPSATPKLTEKQKSQIQSALRWSAFWQPGEFVNYVAGETIPVKVVPSPQEFVVFLTRIRLRVDFERSGTHEWDRVGFVGGLSRIGDETAESDVQFYIQLHLRIDPEKADRFARVPARRDAIPGTIIPAERLNLIPRLSPESFSIGDDDLHLPVLTPPEYVDHRRPPVALEKFIAAVTREVQQYLPANGRPATVQVPYFSADDPRVYVYVDFHQPESEGILHMVHDGEDGWANEMMSLNRGPNDFKALIEKIRSLKMLEFSVRN